MKFITTIFSVLALTLVPPAHAAVTLVINEFMADNGATVADPQGHYDDWIEIYNPGPGTVDLGGMYLTDDLLNPTQWQFPSNTYIAAGGYLLVWADEDILDTPGLHANFKLSAGGEEIALFSTNGTTLVDSIAFGSQTEDSSYGRFPNGDSTWYFMDQPSPNAANATAQSEAVYFSRLGGIMTDSFTLKLSTKSDAGSIRYSTDGTEPSASSTLYNDGSGISINNSQSRRIRARAFQSGLAPGPVRTEAYLAVSPALAAFDSNLPILVIDTFGDPIPQFWNDDPNKWMEDVYATAIDTNGVTGRAALTDQPDFAGRTGMRMRGSSSLELDKKPYKLETWDEADQDKKVSLLGFPSESDWVLHNPHTDKTFMRNVLVYQWGNDMGHYSSRTKFIEVFKNEDGGQIGGPGSSDYVGVYVLMEQIKQGKDRVDVEKLLPTENAEPELTGGYIIKHDRKLIGEDSFSTWAGEFLYVEPAATNITTAQKNYIKTYIEDFEAALQGPNFDDPVTGYAKYIDVESFIDHDFCSEIAKDVDAYWLSTFMEKDRGGKLAMSAQWDYNLSMGNNDYSLWSLTKHHTTAWNREPGQVEYRWHARLLDDPEYRLKYADRWFHLRETVLSDTTVAQTIDDHVALLNAEAAGRNFSRWDILNSLVNFSWLPNGPNFYYGGNPLLPCFGSDHTYWMQAEWLKNWLTGTGTPTGTCAAEAFAPQYADRLGWIDDNMDNRTGASAPPALFINGSPADTGSVISAPATLTMSGSSGTIYYTLDGTDPREAFTGNAVGTVYSGTASTTTVLLDTGDACTARIPTSAGDAAGWKEIGYSDTGWPSGTTGVGYETSPATYDYTPLIGLDVSSMQGVNSTVYIRVPFTLADTNNVTGLTLKMKYDDAFVAYINGMQVLASANAPATLSWNSGATNFNDDANAVVFQEYDITASIGTLQEGDNLLAIHGLNYGTTSSDLLFVPRLEASSTSTSSGDIILNTTVDVRARIKNGSSWSAMNQAVFADDQLLSDLRITEIMYHPETPGAEYIELKNIGASPINLYLCEFTDGIKFTFPDMTLAAGQHVLVVETQTVFEATYGTGLNIAGEFNVGSALDNGGEEIVLRDAAGREIHDFDYNDWYPVTDGRGASLGIIDPAHADLTLWDRKEGWQASSTAGGSPGTDNTANIVANGSIVINEALTHTDVAGGDWIELLNTTGTSIDIGGWYLSDNLDDLRKYQIASGTSIPAGGFAVFTQDANFGLASSDPGKLTGFGLSELGESIFLSSGSGGNLSGGFSISEDFGAATREVTFGRHTKSPMSGYGVDFVAMESATMGAANSGPLVPDVVINEIMYNPSADSDEVAEYIELFNRSSSSSADLFDPANPANTWKFTKGIDYTFPPGVSIPAGSHILVVRTDPDVFRYVHNIPAEREIYGPYTGALGNDGEKLELSMPGAPEPSFVPYIRTEKVNFSDGAHPVGNDPWPTEPDGTLGYSLHRKIAADYGNDVANWESAAATPVSPDVIRIELQQMDGTNYLIWTASGVLQSTLQLTNSWTDVPGATSPYTLIPDQPAEFFRIELTP